VGDRTWVGSHVRIRPGATIGADVIVLPNSVVEGDVPDGTVVGGVPAKFVAKAPGY
jgi:acetyltransferase-like isoleucine patch superfamily enzyme